MCPKTTELSNKIEENFNDTLSFPKGSVVKDPPEMQETVSIPGLGGSPGKGNDNPLHYSCLKNLMDRGSWKATVQRVVKNI